MGKITVVISDKVNNEFRKFIAKEYPTDTFGKLSHLSDLYVSCYLMERGGMDRNTFDRTIKRARSNGIKEEHIKTAAGEFYILSD